MSHSKVGRQDDQTLYSLLVEAGKAALADANLSGKDIDAVYIAKLRFKPCVRVENACASGATAVAQAVYAIESGRFKNVLVIGVEKMTSLRTAGVTEVLAMASYYPEEGGKGYSFPGLYAEYAKGYMAEYGYSSDELADALAYITCKAHKNAMSNPLAQMHVEYTNDFAKTVSDKNPMIAAPLKLSDCSLVSDGAAALVLTATANALSIKDQVVEITDIVQASDYLAIVEGKRSRHELTAAKYAIGKVLNNSGLTINDIDVAEVHDCFTITELLIYEAMGLTPSGKGRDALLNGYVHVGGKLPVNPSGGLKAKGHPVGATGVSMHVLIAKQLLDAAIGEQVKNASIGMTLNIGGSGATNIASVLRRIK